MTRCTRSPRISAESDAKLILVLAVFKLSRDKRSGMLADTMSAEMLAGLLPMETGNLTAVSD